MKFKWKFFQKYYKQSTTFFIRNIRNVSFLLNSFKSYYLRDLYAFIIETVSWEWLDWCILKMVTTTQQSLNSFLPRAAISVLVNWISLLSTRPSEYLTFSKPCQCRTQVSFSHQVWPSNMLFHFWIIYAVFHLLLKVLHLSVRNSYASSNKVWVFPRPSTTCLSHSRLKVMVFSMGQMVNLINL